MSRQAVCGQRPEVRSQESDRFGPFRDVSCDFVDRLASVSRINVRSSCGLFERHSETSKRSTKLHETSRKGPNR
jgi:hypothetical protein